MATGSKFEIPPNVDPAVLKLQAFQQLLRLRRQWQTRSGMCATCRTWRMSLEAAEALRAAIAALSSDCQPQDATSSALARVW